MSAMRSGTRDLHERIEQRIRPAEALGDIDSYRRLLERYAAYYRCFEEIVRRDRFIVREFGSERLEKSKWLRNDLRELNEAVPVVGDQRSSAEELTLPDFPTRSHLIGGMYVLEGATLGGQVLLRRYGPPRGLPEGAAVRFFEGYRDATGMMWQAFSQTACRLVEAEAEIAAAVDSARATFSSFGDWVVPNQLVTQQ
ncbi:Heme oxygenase [Stratiformator vulcanicus]|uniref:Heme oxygenase n=2 Tax=Stratiformator vulcanicus TaxID=2527980 RepID=A0A517R7B2_9PLAN|nr:Heme oxygenase [Stratiformator vulcanicus]